MMRFSSIKARLFLAGCFLWAIQGAFGQTSGSIAGETLDQSGAAIPGATISLVNAETNAARTALTNEVGAYSFPTLPPGTYNLKAEKAGFKALVQNQVQIQVQQNARIDFRLEVGQVTESVEVRAGGSTIVTENATVGTVIENKRIVELPLNGRNYLQLVSLAPNVSAGFSVQGQASARQALSGEIAWRGTVHQVRRRLTWRST